MSTHTKAHEKILMRFGISWDSYENLMRIQNLARSEGRKQMSTCQLENKIFMKISCISGFFLVVNFEGLSLGCSPIVYSADSASTVYISGKISSDIELNLFTQSSTHLKQAALQKYVNNHIPSLLCLRVVSVCTVYA